VTGDALLELLVLDPALVLEPLALELAALDELLLDPPHPATNAAVAATAATIKACRLDLFISPFSSQR
jgi:hypothetical protein